MCDELLLKVVSISSHEQSYSNRAIINSKVFNGLFSHISIISNNKTTVVTTDKDDTLHVGCIAFNALIRETEQLSCNSFVIVKRYEFKAQENLKSISFNVELLGRYNDIETFNARDIVEHLKQKYLNFAFKVDRKIVVKINRGQKTLILTVRSLTFHNELINVVVGFLDESSNIEFTNDSCSVNLVCAKICENIPKNLITSNWNYKTLGVGGLSKEINNVIRRTFYTRMLPVQLIDQLKLKHTKGILLYGPPGTGKTLLAREIGNLLNAKNIHIISGPQLLNKYVGESEANVRKLFDNAEKEFREKGNYSQLHVIIIDEIDAICKQRGAESSNFNGVGGSVNDNIVNQFLSKIDGMVHINNMLVIGMTNRRNLIDNALLRPGRLEVQIEISLPDEKGRQEIFEIHTNLLQENKKLSSDVNLEELAKITHNFSGAEIEGLVRAAITLAIKRAMTDDDVDMLKSFIVEKSDFDYALRNDVMCKQKTLKFDNLSLIHWSTETQIIIDEIQLLVEHSFESTTSVTCVLIEGQSNSGKTTIANLVANDPRFQYVANFNNISIELSQLQKLFNDAYLFDHSCIILDDIDRMMSILSPLQYLLKRHPPDNCRLLVICTTNSLIKLDNHIFSLVVKLPTIDTSEQLQMFIRESEYNCLDNQDIANITEKTKNAKFHVGCKRVNKLLQITKNIAPENRLEYLLKKITL